MIQSMTSSQWILRMNTKDNTMQPLSVTWITGCSAASASLRMTPNDGRTVDTLDCSTARQRDLENLKERANRKLINFNKDKYRILHFSYNNAIHEYRLGTDWVERSFTESNPGDLVERLNKS